jgi:GTP-binding protein HflX
LHETGRKKATAILVGIINQKQDEKLIKEYLDELAFLIETAGAEPLKRFTQRLSNPDPRTFIGSGKLEEIRLYIEENEVDWVVFDDELSPSQLRNVEKYLKRKIIDRNNLILDIFAARAQNQSS